MRALTHQLTHPPDGGIKRPEHRLIEISKNPKGQFGHEDSLSEGCFLTFEALFSRSACSFWPIFLSVYDKLFKSNINAKKDAKTNLRTTVTG